MPRYAVLRFESQEALSVAVQKHLIGGWQLAGGIAFDFSDPLRPLYLQAIFRLL